ncbi:MAG: hypothetical protein V1822_01680 [Candidatus Micrarchaeota archaeon]
MGYGFFGYSDAVLANQVKCIYEKRLAGETLIVDITNGGTVFRGSNGATLRNIILECMNQRGFRPENDFDIVGGPEKTASGAVRLLPINPE